MNCGSDNLGIRCYIKLLHFAIAQFRIETGQSLGVGWNEDFTLAISSTPTGRATVEELQLNHEGVVNLRRVLPTIDQHPPRDFDQV
ncbi:MAG TPA: hypothetical protein V6C90_01270 [Coleofasciculaceae cyanobacterium]